MTHEQMTSLANAMEKVAKEEAERRVESAVRQIPWEIQRQLKDQIGVMVREAIKEEIGRRLCVTVTIIPSEKSHDT